MKAIATMVFILMTLAGCRGPQFSRGTIELYVMDGGSIAISDMRDFSSSGRFDGEKITLANPSYLIRHPKGDLLWDTGYPDSLADNPDGLTFGLYHQALETKLIDQLAQLGLEPRDITYLSLSHLHDDHSGNANLFANSIFIVNELERQYMFSDEAMTAFGENYGRLESATTISFSNEHDVFGDGTVIIKSMPGHTPGSSVLLVRLENSGTLLLTGDLYTHARARELQTVPSFNLDREVTLDSRRKFEALAAKENARVVIQHCKVDFAALPKFPAFLH